MTKKISLFFILTLGLVGCAQPLPNPTQTEPTVNQTANSNTTVVIEDDVDAASSISTTVVDPDTVELADHAIIEGGDEVVSDADVSDLLEIDSTILLSIAESKGKYEGYINITMTTKEDYGSSCYQLAAGTETDGGSITTIIYGVRKEEGLCTDDLAPAYYYFKLKADPGTYELKLKSGDKTDRYYLTVSEASLELTALNNSFSEAPEAVVDTFPKDRYIVTCSRYSVLKPDAYCLALYDAIVAAGATLEATEATAADDTTRQTFRFAGDSTVLEKIVSEYVNDNYTFELVDASGVIVRYGSYFCGKGYDNDPQHLVISGETVDHIILETNIHFKVPQDWYVLQRIPDDEDNLHTEATAGVLLYTFYCDEIKAKLFNGGVEEYQAFNSAYADESNMTVAYEPVVVAERTWYRVRFVKDNGEYYVNPTLETLVGDRIFEISLPHKPNQTSYWSALENIAAQFSFGE